MQQEAPATRRGGIRPIRWLRAHPFGADLLLAGTLTAISLTFHLLDYDPDDQFISPTWWTTLLVFFAVAPVGWRRRRTIASTCLIVATFLVAAFLDVDGSGFLGVVIAVYSLGAHACGVGRTRTLQAASAAIAVLFAAGLIAGEAEAGDLISSTVVLVTAFVLGDNLRRRRLAAEELEARLERAERERELLAQQRVSDERARIARELHDIVAHSVTGMVIQAAAARRSLDRSPRDAADALDRIESTGRRTMNELRSVLGVLRRDLDDGSDLEPQPGIGRLDELVASSGDLPIELTVTGLDPCELEVSEPGVDLTAYRLVQEGVTNVRRHAGAVTRVHVEVRLDGDTLDVSVTDDGAGSTTPAEDPGYGLVGMRERVETAGGTLRAAPWGSRGWRLHARLPLATVSRAPVDPTDDIRVSP